MSQSPRLTESDASQTTKEPLSAPMIIIATALDTTWRLFAPTLGGVFLGIWLDGKFMTAPIWTIVCLILGILLSILLISRQLINVRKAHK